MFSQLLRPAIFVYALAIAAYFFRWLFLKQSNKSATLFSFKSQLLWLFFFFYVATIVLLTLVPTPITSEGHEKPNDVNLLPVINTARGLIETFKPAKHYLLFHVLENIVGNVLMFMPLGFLLPLLVNKLANKRRVVLVSMICSLSIELLQLLSTHWGIYRTTDIDDVLLNTLGGWIGYIFYQALRLKTPQLTTQQATS